MKNKNWQSNLEIWFSIAALFAWVAYYVVVGYSIELFRRLKNLFK